MEMAGHRQDSNGNPSAAPGPRQPILDTIVRGVQDLRIPANLDWPAARLHFPDNDGQWKFSAVLVAIMPRPEPTILLTRRSSGLSEYSSHVCFPGGRPAESDHDVAPPPCARLSRKSTWRRARSNWSDACPCTRPESATTPSSRHRHRLRCRRLGSRPRRSRRNIRIPIHRAAEPRPAAPICRRRTRRLLVLGRPTPGHLGRYRGHPEIARRAGPRGKPRQPLRASPSQASPRSQPAPAGLSWLFRRVVVRSVT